MTPYERSSRVEYVLARLKERSFRDIVTPSPVEMTAVGRLHTADFLEFMRSASADWKTAGFACHASETAMTNGTWAAALSSAASAQSAQRHVAAGARAAFALCRPPGHHASSDQYGG